jgi:WD40 repeat protein
VSTADEVLRRHFIAIATSTFVASATYPPLDVASEVRTLTEWLVDDALADRRFSNRGYERLADCPTYNQIRDLFTGGAEFNSGDAVVVYVTGHGQSAQGAHWVVLHDSDPSKVSHKSLGTAELIRWLAAYRDLSHVLVIIDLCQAGNVTDELPATLQRDLPEGWFALFTAPAGVTARLGAFSGVLASLITEFRAGTGPGGSNEVEPYLSTPVFVAELQKRLREQYHQKLISINTPYGPSVCLPNPRYDASRVAAVATSPARRDLALLQSALDTHWLHRAPVTSERGSVFTGRRVLMSRLISFVDGPPGALIVTGRAGSGKSAVLARLVTCSDTSFREQYADVLAHTEPVPRAESVDVAVLATGKTADQIARQIVGSLGALDAGDADLDAGDADLDAWIREIERTLGNRDRPVTVVIDGLDEASDPAAVALTLLARLNPPEYQRMRLVIGVRSSGTVAVEDHGGRELADLIAGALNAQRMHADDDEFWEQDDLADYAEQLLARGAPPSARQADLARKIAKQSGKSYLLAGLAARNLAESSDEEVSETRLRQVLGSGVSELVIQDVESSIADPAMRNKTLRLLRTAGLSFGRGIPWRDLWAAAATAIDQARPIAQNDVQWLLGHRISGYLIRDLEDDAATYRLFHDELKAALADGSQGAPDRASAHRAITLALLDASGWNLENGTTDIAPPYIRRHLASHAAEAGILEDVLEADKLPYLDHVRLAELMRLTQPPAHSALWSLLGAWRSVRHRLSWDDPRSNVAALDAALVIAGTTPPRRIEAGPYWAPRWARWTTGGTVVGSLHNRQLSQATFGSVEGRSVLAAASHDEIQIWEAATGRAVGQPFRTHGDVAAVAMGGDDGAILAAIGEYDGKLTIWDAATRIQLHDLSLPGGGFRSLAMGRLHGSWVVAAAGFTGQVFTRWADSGEEALPPFRTAEFVRSLVIAQARAGPTMAVGHADGTIAVWDLERGVQLGMPIAVHAQITTVDLAEFDEDGALLAVGTIDGLAGVWDVASHSPVGMPWQRHGHGAVHSVALGKAGEVPMLAAGCHDGTVHLSPAAQPTNGTVLPHPGIVTTVEFGDADGQIMLATACQDGNTRLWDPVQPSAPRVEVDGRIGSVALVAHDSGAVDVFTGNDRAELQWWSGGDGRRLLQIDLAGTHRYAKGKSVWHPPSAEVAVGYVRGRLIALTSYLGTIKLLELGDPGRDQAQLIREHGYKSVALHVGNGQALFAPRNNESAIVVYDAFTGRPTELRPTPGSGSPAVFSGVSFHSSRGRTYLTFMDGRWLTLFEGEHWTPLGPPIEVSSPVEPALGMLEGEQVVAILGEGELRICDVRSGKDRIAPIRTSQAWGAVAFARLGQRDVVLTAHFSTIRVWNPFTGRRLTQLPFGTGVDVMAVHSSQDGTVQVAVGGPGLLLTQLRERRMPTDD